MSIHLVGLPHTGFSQDRYSNCAFTTKSVRLAHMLAKAGEDVHVYWGGPAYEGPWTFHSMLTEAEQEQYYGTYSANNLPVGEFNPTLEPWVKFNERAIEAIGSAIDSEDIIAIIAGTCQQSVINAFPGHSAIEPEVGYEGICHNTFACFESYAWMHHRYGACGINDGRAFDAVIPNFHDPADFEIGEDHGYLLFMGRHVLRKGVAAAGEIAAAAGIKLLTAGNGVVAQDGDFVVCTDGTRVQGNWVGSLGPVERKSVLSHATALIVPTLYIEPFGTVQIEAMMSGVPVIAPDYGVFTETITEGVNGFRYRMQREAVAAVRAAPALREQGKRIRQDAIDRFSMDVCGAQFEQWLTRIRTLRGRGWYAE